MISDKSSSIGELRTAVIEYLGNKIMITLHNSIADTVSVITWVNLSTKSPPEQMEFKGLTRLSVSNDVFYNLISDLSNKGGVIIELS